MQNKSIDLCVYRINSAIETLEAARACMDIKHYKDAINRSYYAAFYAIKAVLAIEEVDFKRHKDVVAYFNKNYVANERFEKTMGRILATLQQKREASDYDDFYVASKEEAEIQYKNAGYIVNVVKMFLANEFNVKL